MSVEITYKGQPIEKKLEELTKYTIKFSEQIQELALLYRRLSNYTHTNNMIYHQQIDDLKQTITKQLDDIENHMNESIKKLQQEVIVSQTGLLEKIFHWFSSKKTQIKTSVVDLTKQE